MKKTAMVAVLFYALGVITMVGCASFPWRYYGTQMDDTCYDKGNLLGKQGKQGWPNLPLAECKPDVSIKLKCITVPIDDFYSFKADDEKCHSDLNSCEKNCKAGS